MYSRYHSGSDRPIRLPEHYNGCAFAVQSKDVEKPQEQPPQPPRFEQTVRVFDAETEEKDTKEESTPVMSLMPFRSMAERIKRGESGRGELGFEELLLLGLILLLMGSEDSSETVLWLVLLLLCG